MSRTKPALTLFLLVCTTGCALPPQQMASLSGKQPPSTCKFYTGSRLCREPYEVPQSLSCDAFHRSIDQGYANDPGAQSCYGLNQSVDASPDVRSLR